MFYNFKLLTLKKYSYDSKRENSRIPKLQRDYMLGKRKLSLEIIEAILNAFPEISAEWLLRGTGNMILNEFSNSTQANDFDETWYKKIVDDQHDLIQMQKERIKFLEKNGPKSR